MKKIFSVLTLSLLLTNLSFAQSQEEAKSESLFQSIKQKVSECREECLQYHECRDEVKMIVIENLKGKTKLQKMAIGSGALALAVANPGAVLLLSTIAIQEYLGYKVSKNTKLDDNLCK